jgi:enediyne biosynthesis thioesterase
VSHAYEYRHIVGFEETNLVGNVYFVNHLRWQGRCREMFLREHVPALLSELEADLALVTLNCSCEYLDEIIAFDEIIVRMTLEALTQSRMTLNFEYWRRDQIVARGQQQVACMRRQNGKMIPAPAPEVLLEAVRQFVE